MPSSLPSESTVSSIENERSASPVSSEVAKTHAGFHRIEFSLSKAMERRAAELIPGGSHTYAKGSDQYPQLSPSFIERGKGCHVWDVDGNEFIEYAMGLRSVTLGHAYPPVVEAAYRQILRGNNFNRPASIEVECAEMLLSLNPGMEMVKFTKDGSTANTAAVKLARAYTGRDLVAICSDSPFYSYDDWAIGTTEMDAGIPDVHKSLTLQFRYNNIDSLRELFDRHPGRIAIVMLEPMRTEEPRDGFLQRVQQLCHRNGSVFLLDETITGFRWAVGGSQKLWGVVADLSVFGKAMANGFALSALAGKRDIMRLGGLDHDKPRVFLLSTTHGAENPALAAAVATMKVYRDEPVIEHLNRQGERLRSGMMAAAAHHGLLDYFSVFGPACGLIVATNDPQKKFSYPYRTLFLQEMIKRGVLAPTMLVSYSHTDDDIDRTIEATAESLEVYKRALEDGLERYLVGPPAKSVYRKFN
jgi:glutamate-1-semialdehyde 2,1-aminomutase